MTGPGPSPDLARDVAIARAWLLGWAADVAANRAWLTDLDAAIGDGDHGINLDRGLAAVAADLMAGEGGANAQNAGPLLAAAGRRLMGVVGGASGALYGRAFVRAGEAVTAASAPGAAPGASEDRVGEVALEAAIDAIATLGKAVRGDKTMLDALVPALEALRAHRGEPRRHDRAATAAEAGADATVPLVARRGRASYLGERSAGHRDPGAASAAMLVRALARAHAPA
ncbi:MAG TPA: dihydroxyacetone kinase subunit DhaL [Candidatus Limnocylindrales bacterium]|nr:dihydroxyacetone kinase subunit DhaL [Candidatus Limnocylindrales bacterium]